MTTNQSDNWLIENIKAIEYDVQQALIQSHRAPTDCQIMAVTKTVPAQLVNRAIQSGISLIGENRVQECLSKWDSYQLENAQVHFIGHLQTNKVKSILPKVSMIESVSSIKLAQEIHKVAKQLEQKQDILLQVNIGKESSKSGFFIEQLPEALYLLQQLPNIQVRGLMCIPPKDRTEYYFSQMEQLFFQIQQQQLDNIIMDTLSMGMSSDFKLAIKYHSNIVRLGTILFGSRNTI